MELSKETAFAGIVAIEYCLTLTWMGIRVGAARRKYGVSYPTLYARVGDGNIKDEKQATEYNCVQRGHQNMFETFPSVVSMVLVAGLKVPLHSPTLDGSFSALSTATIARKDTFSAYFKIR